MESETLLQIVQKSDWSLFLQWYETAKKTPDIKQTFQNLSEKDITDVWNVFRKWVKENSAGLTSNSLETNEVLNTLLVLAMIADHSIKDSLSTKNQGLVTSVIILNNTLEFIHQDSELGRKLGTVICEFCEKLWKFDRRYEVKLFPRTAKWLVNLALDPQVKTGCMKRLLRISDVLLTLGFSTLESFGLIQLFLGTVSNLKFIDFFEGRKFIVKLFQLGTNMIEMVHNEVKRNITLLNPSECRLYGDIYFRAWKETTEDCRAQVESSIQDLMMLAVIAFRKPVGAVNGGVNRVAMNKLLFNLLHSIHQHKTDSRAIAFLLNKLYRPVLWRQFDCANGLVRANALSLLIDAYPLETDEGRQENDELLSRHWDIISKALMDDVDLVRSAAAEGACHFMADNWLILPTHITEELITIVVGKLMRDSASVDVRLSALKGVSHLLNNKLTHQMLAKKMPLTKNVLHDVNEKVRANYVELLIRVQKLGVAELRKIVDVEHLLLRLEVETSENVRRNLVTLLAPLYCPDDDSPAVILQACLALVMDNHAASRNFYLLLHGCVTVRQIAQLIATIGRYLGNFVTNDLDKSDSAGASRKSLRMDSTEVHSASDEDKENESMEVDESEEGAEGNGDRTDESDEPAQVIGLLDTAWILLKRNRNKLKAKDNLKYWRKINRLFTKLCPKFLRYFRQRSGLSSLVHLYGQLSAETAKMMVSFVKSQLKSMDECSEPSEFGYLVDAMCNWGKGDEVLEFILCNVKGGFPVQQLSAGRRSVQFAAENKPLLGLRCLSYLLQNADNQKIVFRQNLKHVEDLTCALEEAMSLTEKQPENLTNGGFLVEAARSYVALVGLLSCTYQRNDSEKYSACEDTFMNIFTWLRRLNVLESAGAQSLVCAVLRTICNLVMIDSFEHCTPFINLVGESVDRFRTARFVTLGFICSYSYLESLWIRKQSTNEESNRFTEAHDGPGAVLKKTLECWSLLPVEDAFCTEDLAIVRELYRKLFILCYQHKSASDATLVSFMQMSVDILRVGMRSELQSADETCLSDFTDLPQRVNVIVSAFRTRKTLTEMVLEVLMDSFDTLQNDMILQEFTGLLRLFMFLSNQGLILRSVIAAHLQSMDLISSKLELHISATDHKLICARVKDLQNQIVNVNKM